MNPNEPNNQGGGGTPVEPAIATSSDSIIAGLENKVAAEKVAQGIGIPPAEPLSTGTPQERQFTDQFGSKVTQPVAETPVLTDVRPPAETPADAPVTPLDSSINPNLTTAEAASQPEQPLREKVVQQIEEILAQYDLTEKKPEEVAA